MCSSFRAYLEFSGRQDERVCTFCHQVLAGTQASYLQELGQVSVTDASNKVMQGFMAGKLRLQVVLVAGDDSGLDLPSLILPSTSP